MSWLLRKAPFPSTGLGKAHFESLHFINEQAEVPSIPLGTPGSRHMVPLGSGDSWMGHSRIYSWDLGTYGGSHCARALQTL